MYVFVGVSSLSEYYVAHLLDGKFDSAIFSTFPYENVDEEKIIKINEQQFLCVFALLGFCYLKIIE